MTQKTKAQNSPRQNHIIAELSENAYRRLLPNLDLVFFEQGELVFEAGKVPNHVFFPISCILGLSYDSSAGAIGKKGFPIGNEGMAGISTFLSGPTKGRQAEVMIAGHAYRLGVEDLLAEFDRGTELNKLLLHYVDAVLLQTMQLVYCGQTHRIEQRLCRFLLRIFDRLPSKTLSITHEQIAYMLGVRRVTITTETRKLHEAGIISSKYGGITLLNRRAMEAQTCECYSVLKKAFNSATRKPKA